MLHGTGGCISVQIQSECNWLSAVPVCKQGDFDLQSLNVDSSKPPQSIHLEYLLMCLQGHC